MANIAELVKAPRWPDSVAFAGPSRGSLTCVASRELEQNTAAWDSLAANASTPNPFFESWFLLPALRAFDPAGDVRILCFETGDQLAGLLPIVRQQRYYRRPVPNLTGWLHHNCFLGAPLVAHGAEAAFWQAFFDWADSKPGNSLFLHLRQLPLDGALYEALKTVLAAQNRQVAVVHREERALLASQLTPDAYLEAAISGKKRKELRRQFARLCEAGEVVIERREDAEGLGDWIDRFLKLESAGWKGKAGSALACSPQTAGLFRESLQGAAAHGKLARLTLLLDGNPIAMLATFLAPPGAYSFKTAFDESFARFSPGVLLQRENLAMLGHAGIDWTDSCAEADHPMIDHIWRERRAVGSVSIAIGGSLRRAAFGLLVRAETRHDPEAWRL